MGERGALGGVLVVELGQRIAAGVAGTLLAQAGADVVVVEAPGLSSSDKAKHRAQITAGKQSILLNGETEKTVRDLVRKADVVIQSDTDAASLRDLRTEGGSSQVVCDISAFGSSGPMAGQVDSEILIQAISGIMDVTGMPDGVPTAVGLPFLEVSAGLYAASAITAALRGRDRGGRGQAIEVSLYDCAVNAQATFLPFHFDGRTPRRSGNRHSMCAPWNCYKAKDRWILICSATNDQWLRLCEVMGRGDLASNKAYENLADRLARCDDVDAAVQEWAAGRTFNQCVDALAKAGLACGPIVPISDLENEPNLKHRKFVKELDDPVSRRKVKIADSPFRLMPALGQTASHIPAPGEGLDAAIALARSRSLQSGSGGKAAAPLAGVRVLEIGQYTTAPLAARHLATLGAQVIKIEPPQGESSRFWPPHKNGQGYFFTMSNSDKSSVLLDLAKAEDTRIFRDLLRSADVFIENTKPGSLKRRGFGPDDLASINPRLIYCGISGFGAESAYPQRPAFDTVVQAMSGVMDLTKSGGVPVKAGISIADILGGQFALLAVLLALKLRDTTNKGAFIDLAMQEACAWATQFSWQGETVLEHTVVTCKDGYCVVEAGDNAVRNALAEAGATLSIEELITLAETSGAKARRVLSVSEVAAHPQTLARNLIIWRADADNVEWPLLGSPMRLEGTPPRVSEPIGALGSGNPSIDALIGGLGKHSSAQKREQANV